MISDKEIVIVDTHIFIWDILDPEKIPSRILKLLNHAQEHSLLFLCSISLWETGMLVGKDRIQLNRPVDLFLKIGLLKRKYQLIEITPEIAHEVSKIAHSINKDPADQIIAATTLALSANLITVDKNLRKYKYLNTIW